jgi:hypothetical protein
MNTGKPTVPILGMGIRDKNCGGEEMNDWGVSTKIDPSKSFKTLNSFTSTYLVPSF